MYRMVVGQTCGPISREALRIGNALRTDEQEPARSGRHPGPNRRWSGQKGKPVSEHLDDYFDVKRQVDAAGDVVSEMVNRIAAAVPALERWKLDHVPHEPWRKRTLGDPLAGLQAWPSWEAAEQAFRQHREWVGAMEQAYTLLSPDERKAVADPTLRPK